jgi:signal transduction histidine kinase
MSFDQFTQYLSWAIYLTLFLVLVWRAVRQPLRANVDMALLFSAPTVIIGIGLLATLGLIHSGPIPNAINTSLLLLMGYLLLRLVDDFTAVPVRLLQGATISLAVLVLGTFLFNLPRPVVLTLLQIAYVVGTLLYATVAFVRASRGASGVTARRMWAVAAGALCLCLLFAVATVTLVIPALSGVAGILTDLTGLCSAISFFLGFAPPRVLRRAWQEPDLRAFLARAARLPRLPDTAAIIAELERGAATSLGAPRARVGLWDDTAALLRFTSDGGPTAVAPTEDSTTGQAFLHQHPTFTPKIGPANPLYGAVATRYEIQAVLAAPITAGERRLGVLVAYAPRAPIFADEDLALVQLLADQAAVILESRALIDEAARVQAREEVTRLKEDFLSAAAHDLKTPLTTLVGLTELMERRAMRNPDAPVDLANLQKLKREAHRLTALVLELLDAARAEQGRLVGEQVALDLAEVARETCERHTSDRHACTVDAPAPVPGVYDANRISQLLENLIENAIKYSPDGGPVQVRVWREGAWNHLCVQDQGIGIPEEDYSHVFERFHRGTNVDDRQFAGMGLGLYICRGIAEQHGGRIWVERPPVVPGRRPRGTTFHVALPASPATDAAPAGELAGRVGGGDPYARPAAGIDPRRG